LFECSTIKICPKTGDEGRHGEHRHLDELALADPVEDELLHVLVQPLVDVVDVVQARETFSGQCYGQNFGTF
jgi:hypothetical protein